MEKKVYYNNIKKNEKQKKLIKLLIVAVIISIVLLCFCFVFIKKQNELNNIQIFQIVFQNQKNGTVYFYSKKSLKNINIIQSQEADNIIYIEQTFFISFIDKDKIYIINVINEKSTITFYKKNFLFLELYYKRDTVGRTMIFL